MSQGVARPKVPWGGPKGVQKGPVSGEVAAWRVVRVLLILTNPVAAVMTAAGVVGLTRPAVARRIRGWWVAGVGAVWIVAGSMLGFGRSYLTPWREAWAALPNAVDPTKRFSLTGLAEVAADRWPSWLLGQVPMAIGFAAAVAGLMVARRQRYAASWRDAPEATWDSLSKRKIAAGHRRADAGEQVTETTPFNDLRMSIGINAPGKVVYLHGQAMKGHIVVTGPTNIGKTTTLLRVMHGWLVRWAPKRLPLIMFDFKGDPDLRADIEDMAKKTGRGCHVVSITGPSMTYNALKHGTSEDVASRIIETLANSDGGGFSEPHHRVVGERWLNMSMLVLDHLVAKKAHKGGKVGKPVWKRTLTDLAELMTPDAVGHELGRLDGEAETRARRLLADVKAEDTLLRSILGMGQRIALMTETATRHVFLDEADGIDLYESIKAGDVVLFSLNSQANAAAARAIGNLALADLTGLFGRLQDERWSKTQDKRLLLVLDEFTGLGGSLLSNVLERARGAGGTLMVSTQGDGGFEAVSPEFADAVWTNSNVWMLHRQVGESASTRAEAIGTRSAWSETVQVTEDTDALGSTTGASGVGSLRKVEQFRVHPNEFKELGVGEIVFVSWWPLDRQRVRVTQLPQSESREAEEVTQESKPAQPTITATAATQGEDQPPTTAAEKTTEPAKAVSGQGWVDDVEW